MIVLEVFSVPIASFKQDRFIRVYLPQSYHKETKRYPVLYMHDGKNVFRDQDAAGGTSLELESYLEQNKLDVIVVGIDQNCEERINEYCPWANGDYSKRILGHASSAGGKGALYIDFIVHELKPLIDNKYRTLKDCTAMAGISLGGLISTYAACRYPYIFKNITALSSAFFRNQEEIERLLQDSDLSAIERFYLDCGTKEAGVDDRISKEFLVSNLAVYEILKEKVPHAQFKVINDAEHSYVFFKERVPQLFSFLQT
ncbi:MAG: alpha/beta hydrolase [Ectobacillus sp.]